MVKFLSAPRLKHKMHLESIVYKLGGDIATGIPAYKHILWLLRNTRYTYLKLNSSNLHTQLRIEKDDLQDHVHHYLDYSKKAGRALFLPSNIMGIENLDALSICVSMEKCIDLMSYIGAQNSHYLILGRIELHDFSKLGRTYTTPLYYNAANDGARFDCEQATIVSDLSDMAVSYIEQSALLWQAETSMVH